MAGQVGDAVGGHVLGRADGGNRPRPGHQQVALDQVREPEVGVARDDAVDLGRGDVELVARDGGQGGDEERFRRAVGQHGRGARAQRFHAALGDGGRCEQHEGGDAGGARDGAEAGQQT